MRNWKQYDIQTGPQGLCCLRCGDGADKLAVFCGMDVLYNGLGENGAAQILPSLFSLCPNDITLYVLGYGCEDGTPETMARMIEGYGEFLRQQGGKFNLIGFSLGGPEAIRVAARYPEIVERLALVSSAHTFSKEGKASFKRLRDCVEQGDISGALDALVFRSERLDRMLASRMRREEATLYEQNPKMVAKGLQRLYPSGYLDLQRVLYSVHMPMLVVGGSEDFLFSGKEFAATAAHVQGAYFKLYPGATHRLAVEKRRALRRDLDAWLNLQPKR